MTHTNPRVPCLSRPQKKIRLSTHCLSRSGVACFWFWNAFGGIPRSSVNPDTKCGVPKKHVYTMSSRFLTLVSLAQKSWDHPIIGLKSCPPPTQKITVIGLMFHPKASGWMFFWFLETDSRNWSVHTTKHRQSVEQRNSSSFWF